MTAKTEAPAKTEITKIYSMASSDIVIARYEKEQDGSIHGARSIEQAIVILGGANVAYSDAEKIRRNTKWGVTDVTAQELKILKANPSFGRMVDRGFMKIGEAPNVLKVDKSAQLTEKQMKAKTPKAKVSTGEAEE